VESRQAAARFRHHAKPGPGEREQQQFADQGDDQGDDQQMLYGT